LSLSTFCADITDTITVLVQKEKERSARKERKRERPKGRKKERKKERQKERKKERRKVRDPLTGKKERNKTQAYNNILWKASRGRRRQQVLRLKDVAAGNESHELRKKRKEGKDNIKIKSERKKQAEKAKEK
jgi:hypothetical protein